MKTGAAKTKKLRSQAKCALDEDARDQLMRQSQQYQIVRDCRILLKHGELARHPEIRRADVTREEGHPDIKMEEGIGRQESSRALRCDASAADDDVLRKTEDFVRAVKCEKLQPSADVLALIGGEAKVREKDKELLKKYTARKKARGDKTAAQIKREKDSMTV